MGRGKIKNEITVGYCTHLIERRFELVHFVDPSFNSVSIAFSVGAATVKSNVVGIDDKL